MSEISPIILSIGHSTRTLVMFISLLQAHDVNLVIDVRTVPKSRRNPQFNGDTLPLALNDKGIGYRHLPGLGGLRRPGPDSQNMGWRNTSFRGFADYMQTAEFEKNLEALKNLAQKKFLAVMCAEVLPWRCHRSLIADALFVRGIKVEHIMSLTRRQTHIPTSWARINGIKIIYPPENINR